MPPDYLTRLQELCRTHGILYVDDEVQSGVGRTGKMWAVEHYDGVEPDLLVSGKSIGGGLPLAAVTGRAELMDAVPTGGLGGTFGGNPLSCAAAVAVLEAVREPEFLARATDVGDAVRARLVDLASRHSEIGEVRGLGPMIGFELVERTPDRAKAIVDAAFERGLLLLSCGLYGNVIRLLPALTISDEELGEGLGLLEESLTAAAR
jgi:4-aminobutyrate aminotransferase-like enzyme